ncbi:hypothetical protein GWK47_046189 [Chionoecetes opilio]|uniref:Uncharacterized protein n=1 Tax=Chionoecetes opilio TaxID=41210 RepID=A0A8J5CWH6_CHIOP|nr:hypothetical protein GWK47_046189 [Chionoecetes opilio]
MKNKEDQAFLRDQRRERKMAMGGVDQELVRMKMLAGKSEMGEGRWQRLRIRDGGPFPDSSPTVIGTMSQENSPFRGENIIAGQQLPQEALKVTRKWSLRWTGRTSQTGRRPTSSGCGFQLRINACFPKHTSSIQNDDQDGACGGHQDLLPRVHKCRRASSDRSLGWKICFPT